MKMNIRIKTDAVTSEHDAASIDAACAQFAREEGLAAIDCSTLVAEIGRLGGWITIHADDECVVSTAE